jgi:biopolymer transport protein ExbB/TolQ
MKKLLVLPAICLLCLPAFANTSTTTTTYESEEMRSSPSMNADMIEAEEEGYEDSTLDSEDVEQERMEERNSSASDSETEEAIDYSDRTRTNRERKALNTGSDASDDQ